MTGRLYSRGHSLFWSSSGLFPGQMINPGSVFFSEPVCSSSKILPTGLSLCAGWVAYAGLDCPPVCNTEHKPIPQT